MAKQSDKSTAPKSDERNIVSGGPDIEDLEGQLLMIWSKYGKQITASIIAVVLIFIGYQAFSAMARKAERSKQAAYSAVTDDTAKLAFAEKHSGHPLSGLAYKELADAAFAAAEYEKALDLYKSAYGSVESVLQEAAHIGQAMSLVELDQTDAAKAIFEEIAADSDALNQQEAQFRLAGLAVEAGDTATARALIEDIINSGKQTFWLQKALQLQAILPAAEDEAA